MLSSFNVDWVSKKVLVDSEISTVNLMVRWKELAKVIN